MRNVMKLSRASAAGSIVTLMLMFAVYDGAPGPVGEVVTARDGEYAASGSNGTHEGIKVHGHWVIEVRNADGRTTESREFENELLDMGEETLARLLSRELQVVDFWEVGVRAPYGGDSPCLNSLGARVYCVIVEPGHSQSNYNRPNYFTNLTVERVGSEVVLSGGATAAVDGTIAWVTTGFWNSAFTGADIPPINVLAGQSILVTVRLSFS